MKVRYVSCVFALVCMIAASNSQAALTWGYDGSLATWDASVTSGMYVQMYQDVNNDTVVGSISSFSNTGIPDGGNSSDDALIASFNTLTIDAKGGLVNWTTDLSAWSDYYGDDVYTVLYNAASIGTASSAVVIDSTTTTLASSDPADYALSSVGNSWVAVPEPTTLAFLGLGIAAFVVRKKIKS